MYFRQELAKRGVPPFAKCEDPQTLRRELLQIMQREVYGFLPKAPEHVDCTVDELKKKCCAGKAIQKRVTLRFSVEGEPFSFPITMNIPNTEKSDFVVILNFRPEVPDVYIPAEELIDHGVGFASLCYTEVTSDDGNMENGLSGIVNRNRREDDRCGKIALWAYAASRVLDYLLEQEKVGRVAVAGHSRLGKTALLAAAYDERFSCAYSNDSGCAGAAITRGKNGESVKAITEKFPYWFCNNYRRYAGNESAMPFDQHYLAACIAPRKLYIASAAEDLWADPQSEFLTCCAVSEIYEAYGKTGFSGGDRPPKIGDVFREGNVGYHLRAGIHFFSREDWNKFLPFFLK